ncbi:intermembrane transport protein PqiB [Babesia caballi]|uniref:Intermembrane transport protein PqiB n=1 Tax=Babesia caballi TaxID=5871 RepID=A0AAV4LR24_BABCB|nr:intermembrane transport protein PqiB [Babesia caballi]
MVGAVSLSVSALAAAAAVVGVAGEALGREPSAEYPYAHFLVDHNEPTLYAGFCGRGAEATREKYRISCCLLGKEPLDLWLYGRADVTRVLLSPAKRLDQTHRLNSRTRSEALSGRGAMVMHRELNFRIVLRLYRQNGPFNEGEDKKPGAKVSKGTTPARFTNGRPTSLAFLQKNDAKVEAKEDLWSKCHFNPYETCKGQTNFARTVAALFGGSAQKLLANQQSVFYKPGATNEPVYKLPSHVFVIPEETTIIKIAEKYITTMMTMYTLEARKRMEQQIWRRECLLVNEVNELFHDLTDYYPPTYEKIQQMIVAIMGGFYSLARITHDRLQIILNKIKEMSLDNLWKDVERWEKQCLHFKWLSNVKLKVMMRDDTYRAIEEAVAAYTKALAQLREETTKGTGPSSALKSTLEQRRKAVDKLVESEVPVTGTRPKHGTVSTTGWFASVESAGRDI